MPIAHKSESNVIPQKKVEASNKLNLDAIATLTDVGKKIEIKEEPIQEYQPPVSVLPEEKTEAKKYADTVLARFSKGKRNEFKAFFSSNGVSMNSGIEMCIEYVKNKVESGELTMSKAGLNSTNK